MHHHHPQTGCLGHDGSGWAGCRCLLQELPHGQLVMFPEERCGPPQPPHPARPFLHCRQTQDQGARIHPPCFHTPDQCARIRQPCECQTPDQGACTHPPCVCVSRPRSPLHRGSWCPGGGGGDGGRGHDEWCGGVPRLAAAHRHRRCPRPGWPPPWRGPSLRAAVAVERPHAAPGWA